MSNNPENPIAPIAKQYFTYLDALRCLAFLAVFYAHTGSIFLGGQLSSAFPLNIWQKFTVYGSYGVNFFFVLSGFLITYLLLKEKHSTGTVAIRSFYGRRVLRIWPVYFITLFFAMFVLPHLISPHTWQVFNLTNPHMSWQTFWYFFFFSGNFYQGLELGMASLSIGILWSVCVEEQFYLVWPWIVRWFSMRNLVFVTTGLISLSLLFKFIWADNRIANYYLPWSVGMDLGAGALMGIFYYAKRSQTFLKYTIGTAFACIMLLAAAALSIYIQTAHFDKASQIVGLKTGLIDLVRLLKTPIIDCVFICVLLFFIHKTNHISNTAMASGNRSFIQKCIHFCHASLHISKRKIFNALTYLGKVSYGLYAYHTICLMLSVQFFSAIGLLEATVNRTMFFIVSFFGFILTIIAAHFSFKLIEKRFLNMKDKLHFKSMRRDGAVNTIKTLIKFRSK